jgi:hypothetical protein
MLRQLGRIQFCGYPPGSRHFVPSTNLNSNLWRVAPRDFPSGEKLRLALSTMEKQLDPLLLGGADIPSLTGCATFLQSGRNTCVVLWA